MQTPYGLLVMGGSVGFCGVIRCQCAGCELNLRFISTISSRKSGCDWRPFDCDVANGIRCAAIALSADCCHSQRESVSRFTAPLTRIHTISEAVIRSLGG